MDEDFRKAALDYHRLPRPGKLADRSRPSAWPPSAIWRWPIRRASPRPAWRSPPTPRPRYDYTARGNLVGVISNGTAVLGLGNIGALASKPVMEGKAVLFKKFAGIDVFDIEVDEQDPERFCDVVAALEPTFGAINLEDIKAPECFAIEAELRARMKIPVFHDDQHGTAITVAAAVRNGLMLQGKQLEDVRLVTSGAGAAALACVDLLVAMGLKVENVTLTDIKGVVHAGREETCDDRMARYARDTDARTLHDVLDGADIFMGLSAPRVLKAEWLPSFAPKPLILALANPEPEILPRRCARRVRTRSSPPGAATTPTRSTTSCASRSSSAARSTCSATEINEEMKLAAVEAIAELARVEASEVVAAAYGGAAPVFGPDYIIPKPFDPRLILADRARRGPRGDGVGVATRPITDFAAYRSELERFVFRSGQLMRPVFEAAGSPSAHRLRRGRGRAGAARRADAGRRRHSPADPDRPQRRDRASGSARWACAWTSDESVQILDPAADEACSTRW